MNQPGSLSLIDKYAARLLMLSFFLPMQLQVVVAFTMSFYFIFRTIQSGERTPPGNYLLSLFLGAGYLLYIVAIPFTSAPYKDLSYKLLEYRVSYLLLPVVFASVSRRKIRSILDELAFFVYFTVATCFIANIAFVVCLATKAAYFIRYNMPAGGFKDVSHVTYRRFFEVFTGIHPTYLSMYLVFGISILLLQSKNMNRGLKYFLFYSQIIFLLPLLAKSPLLALFVIFIHTGWLRRRALAQYKWMFAGILAVVVLSYLFVPFVSQRVNEMSGFSKSSIKVDVADNSVHERKMILNVDMSALKTYWVTGAGPARLMDLLKQRYFFYSIYYGRDVNWFDPHNEYLYQWLSFGLAGIMLFAGVLALHVTTSIRKKDHLYGYLMLILMITFFTESVLTVQHGVIFYSFFASLLFFYNNGLNIKQQKEN